MERIAVIMGKMHSGGKKNLVMEYYRNIDKNRIQFDFICDADSNAIPYHEIHDLGGKVYEVTPYQHIFKNMKDIYNICKKNNYKIIHGYNGTMNIFAMLVGRIAGIPIRINESISMAHKEDKKTVLKKILKPFSRCFSTHYLANGEECGKWQFGQKLFSKGKVMVFKTVVDTKKNDFYPDVRKDTREEFGIDDSLVIGHIGRLTAQKNTLFIIDIFSEINRIEPNAKLLIIGDGELKNEMLDRISNLGLKDNVLYLGRREDIQKFYNAMDCFLLPSLYEGLPVVGVESETCGLPVFFSNEIPRESSPCDDLGYFIDLSETAGNWAKAVVSITREKMDKRKSRADDVRDAGFDSVSEAAKLSAYYEELLSTV